MPTSKSYSTASSQYFVFKTGRRLELGWQVGSERLRPRPDVRQTSKQPTIRSIADVKANSVYQALPDDKKSYDLPNKLSKVNGIFWDESELPEAVGRTLPWSYDGLI
jgi:hypothetical protein